MGKATYFELFYKKEFLRNDFSLIRKQIQGALSDALDEEFVKFKDDARYRFAYKVCVNTYNSINDYEYQIEKDIRDIDRGIAFVDDETKQTILDMAYVCDTYHKYFEYVDDSLFDRAPQGDLGGNKIETQTYEVDTTSIKKQNDNPETIIIDKQSDKSDEPILVCDSNKEHRTWFVKVLRSKIPNVDKEGDTLLYHCLRRLYKELCNSDCVNPSETDEAIFIYRFSGFNGPFSPEKKILWKKKNVFLGYIVRCLISDNNNSPMNQGIVASYFLSKSGKSINLSVETRSIKDFEKEKDSLHPDLVKAVELLRKCKFVNVEQISSRR